MKVSEHDILRTTCGNFTKFATYPVGDYSEPILHFEVKDQVYI